MAKRQLVPVSRETPMEDPARQPLSREVSWEKRVKRKQEAERK